jgi:signal peptidase I
MTSRSLSGRIPIWRLLQIALLGLGALHLLLGMVWLAMLLAALCLFLWLYLAKHRVAVGFRRLKWVSYPTLLLGAFTLGILLQTLFIGIAHIPSGSMESTLRSGDVVWFSKLRYGPRLPASPLEVPWVNVLFYLAGGKEEDSSHGWGYHRLRGYSQPKRNDIVIFTQPHRSDAFIKRCVALPGDTIIIANDSVLINGGLIAEPYAMHTKPAVDSLVSKAIKLIVPYKGFTIATSSEEWGTYSQLIQQHEGKRFSPARSDSSFTFQQDYFYMLGDNRHNSNDSRHFGPIPESAIVGRATRIIYSKSGEPRVLKRIE